MSTVLAQTMDKTIGRGQVSGAGKSARKVEIKTGRELEKMRLAGRIVAQVLEVLRAEVRPGVTTGRLDLIAAREIEKRGALPAFLDYCGYPAVICASINEEVVHGIPDAGRVLSEGDILSLDMGVIVDGYYGDAAVTVPVGSIKPEIRKLLDVTRESLNRAVAAIVPGARVGDVSAAVENYVRSNGMSVVRDFVGHGIGRALHEEPPVPNYGKAGTGLKLEPGLVVAVEPMVCLGRSDVRVKENRWTAVTCDGSWSAHFEHTIAVTGCGSEILTLS